MEERMYCATPLIESLPLTNIAKIPVYLKLENAQPTSSFKQRGMSYRCKQVFTQGHRNVIISSSGNGGIALAYCARKLRMKCTVVIRNGTSESVKSKLKEQGADIITTEAACWDDVDIVARKIAEETGAFYVHPFDHPDIWEGNSTIIKEIAEEIQTPPSVVITCVGGGGLLCGLIRGMQEVGWGHIPLIAMETEGTGSFNASVKAGKLVRIPEITSIVASLAAACVCTKLMEYIQQQTVFSELVSDRQAVLSSINFANDHRILVEPASGAALAAVYSGILLRLMQEGKIKNDGPAIVIVCGGNGVDLDTIKQWKNQFSI